MNMKVSMGNETKRSTGCHSEAREYMKRKTRNCRMLAELSTSLQAKLLKHQ
jgi:hypothetical protein